MRPVSRPTEMAFRVILSHELEVVYMDSRYFADNDEGLDMARRSKKGGFVTDEDLVNVVVSKLKQAGTESAAFVRIRGEIEKDPRLGLSELAAIAVVYRGGGPQPASRAAALRALDKRQLELVRNKAQIAQAKKARPW